MSRRAQLRPALFTSRSLAGVTVAALTASLLVVSQAPAHAADSSATVVPAGALEGWTPTSHWMDNRDGTVTRELSPDIRYHTNAVGEWAPVDVAVTAVTDPARWEAASAPNAVRPVLFGATAGRLLELGLDGGSLTLSTPDLTIGRPSVGHDGHSVTYPAVAAGAELQFDVQPSGVKQTLTLQGPASPTSFQFHLADPAGVLGGGRATPDGGYQFDHPVADGMTLTLPAPVAFEASTPGGAAQDDPALPSAFLKVTKHGDGYDLTESVNPLWLVGKTWPIVLDPTLTYAGAATADDCLITSNPTVVNTANCAGKTMRIGVDTNIYRMLVRYNLAGFPKPSSVTDARLVLTSSNVTGGPIALDLREAGAAWNGKTATWATTDGTTAWPAGTTGGAPGATSLGTASLAVAGASATFTSTAFTNLARGWINGTTPNNGLVVKTTSEIPPGPAVVTVHTAEEDNPALRPTLQITYSAPPDAPGSVVATPDDGAAKVSWTAPASNGSPITGYTIRAYAAVANTPTLFSIPGSYVYTVPVGVTSLGFTVAGARGDKVQYGAYGGSGGVVNGQLPVTPGARLTVDVGGHGQALFNGGAGSGVGVGGDSNSTPGNGGDASDIRGAVIAGGGGGASTSASGGGGGYPAGGAGKSGGGAGGSQTAPGAGGGTGVSGSPGVGGNGGAGAPGGPGGGGGYFGGGGGTTNAGGGGGSSWWSASVRNPSYCNACRAGGGYVTITPADTLVATTSVSGSATSATLTGLTNGSADYVTVTATNAIGTGPESQHSEIVTPAGQERPDAFSAAVAAEELGHRVEISALRTDTTSTFVNPDGTQELEASTFNRNLPASDGLLQPVDPMISQATDGSFVTGLHPLRPRFAAAASPTAATVATAGGDIQFGLSSSLASNAGPNGPDGVVYHNVGSALDLAYQVLQDGVKETLVLANATAGSSWTFDVNAPGMVAATNPDGTIVFKDATTGAVRATIPQGAAWDSASTPATVPVQLSLTGTGPTVQIVVSVDPSWLSSSARVFPIRVDPSITAAQGSSTAYKSDGFTCTNTTSTKCSIRGGNSQSGSNAADTYWRSTAAFNYTAIFGKDVTAATINETVTAGTTNCNAAAWYAVSSETYNGYGAAQTSSANICSTGTATGAALVTTLQGWADASSSGKRLFFRGAETSGAYTYKEINATLAITYDSYPDTPGDPSMTPVAGTGPSSYWTSSATPTLKAKVTDPDGGNVRGFFKVYQGSVVKWSDSSAYVNSGGTASITVPASANLADNVVYTVRVYGNDGTDNSKFWSNFIQFQVDTQLPAAPVVTASAYPSGQWTAPATSSTFSWSDTSSDVTGYVYALDANPPSPVTSSTSLPWNPTPGWHTLQVQAVDRAGNYSTPATVYSFGIGSGQLLSPADQDRTQDSVALSATGPSSRPYVQYNWAPSPTATFRPIPTGPSGSITLAGGGTPTPYSNGTFDIGQGLVWKTTKDVSTDGIVLVQACFAAQKTTSPDVCAPANTLQVARTSFGASNATRSFGPGTLSLLTGDLSVSATDASLSTYGGALSVSRSTTTLSPPGQVSGPAGVVGPGWTVSLPDPGAGRTDQTLTDHSSDGYVILSSPDGEEDDFETTDAAGVYPRHYSPVGDASDGTTLVEDPAQTFTVTDTDGTKTQFISDGTSTPVAMHAVTQPGVGSPIYAIDSTTHLLTSVTGQAPPGLNCDPNIAPHPDPLKTPGCRSLLFFYGGPNPNVTDPKYAMSQPVGMVDAAGQLAEIDAVVADPTTGAMNPVPLARYGYNASSHGAHLIGEWDPRISPQLVTGYTYGGNGNRLATLTPPGLSGWTLGYDTSGRLSTVTRHDTALNQDAISTAVYNAPWNDAGPGTHATAVGLTDMSQTATSAWGENSDIVANATAIFGPDHVPAATPNSADWPFASLAYLDVNGREVNTASYGAGAWQIDTTRYDQHGNAVSQLSADNRNQALHPTSATDPAVAALTNPLDRVSALSSLSIYSSDGSDLLETLGPEHPVTTSDSPNPVDARSHTVNTYDTGQESGHPSGGSFHLIISTVVSAQTADQVEHDAHTTLTGYSPLASGDGDGWTLRMPTSVTTVVPGGSNVTHWTRFDDKGRVIETRLPMGAATNGVGTDARSTVTRYYAPGAAWPCSNAGASVDPGVLYAGLVCQTGPPTGGQPSGSQPSMPTSTTTGYTMWQQPTTVEERDVSNTLLRTTSSGYDTAGRTLTSGVVTTSAVTGGATSTSAVPAVTYGYNPDTGLPTTLTSSAGMLVTHYDSQGRTDGYTDASGNISATSYDIAGRVATRSDGKATYTYHYDYDGGTSEHRGLVTQLDTGISATGYSGAASYKATYDAAGHPVITLPNGDVATSTFDNAGQQTALAYTGQGLGSTGVVFNAAYDSLGRKISSTGPISTQTYAYTAVGELATSVRNVGGTCTSQAFGYNANSDRTGWASSNTCTPPVGSLPTVHSYDEADRLLDGSVYDQLGRTTTAPAATLTGGANVAVGYFDNDMVRSQAQNSHTQTFTLDPSGHRIISQADSVTGTSTNNYADGGDSPAWTATPNAGWTRNIDGLSGLGAIETYAVGSGNKVSDTVALQLTDLNGSVVTTVDDSVGAIVRGVCDYDPFGASIGSTPAPAKYGWLGGKQRAADDLGGLVLMGYRLYNPSTGRFFQTDPVPGGSSNDYDYAGQDPINKFDLDGRCMTMCWAGSWANKITGGMSRGAHWLHRHAAVSAQYCFTICGFVSYQNGDLSFGGGQLGIGGFGKFAGYNSASSSQQRAYNWGGCVSLDVGVCGTMGQRAGRRNQHHYWWGGGPVVGEGVSGGINVNLVSVGQHGFALGGWHPLGGRSFFHHHWDD